MATPKQVLKSVGPKLVPFFKTVAIYFVLFIPSGQPSLLAAVIKCLPVLSLIAFVLLHGMSLGEEYAYSRRILLGLVFSLLGDALLIWDDLFLHGLSSFLVAQIFYISAFGFTPFNIYAAMATYTLMGVGVGLLMPGTEGVVSVGVPVYSFFLMTMVWRAVARVQLFEELWTWTKLCSCVGGVLFAVSDTLIGVNAFYCAVPHAQALVMVIYYAAQLGISLSVVDSAASYLDTLHAATNWTTAANTARYRCAKIVTDTKKSFHHLEGVANPVSSAARHVPCTAKTIAPYCRSAKPVTRDTDFYYDGVSAVSSGVCSDTTNCKGVRAATTTTTTSTTTTAAVGMKVVYIDRARESAIATTTSTTPTADFYMTTTTTTNAPCAATSSSCSVHDKTRGVKVVSGDTSSSPHISSLS